MAVAVTGEGSTSHLFINISYAPRWALQGRVSVRLLIVWMGKPRQGVADTRTQGCVWGQDTCAWWLGEVRSRVRAGLAVSAGGAVRWEVRIILHARDQG